MCEAFRVLLVLKLRFYQHKKGITIQSSPKSINHFSACLLSSSYAVCDTSADWLFFPFISVEFVLHFKNECFFYGRKEQKILSFDDEKNVGEQMTAKEQNSNCRSNGICSIIVLHNAISAFYVSIGPSPFNAHLISQLRRLSTIAIKSRTISNEKQLKKIDKNWKIKWSRTKEINFQIYMSTWAREYQRNDVAIKIA